MSYVIYSKETTAIVYPTRYYKTMAAAAAARTRMQKKYLRDNGLTVSNEGPLFDYGVAEAEYYSKRIERTVTRKNLMTGREYTESVNTPICCSPASETYWSM